MLFHMNRICAPHAWFDCDLSAVRQFASDDPLISFDRFSRARDDYGKAASRPCGSTRLTSNRGITGARCIIFNPGRLSRSRPAYVGALQVALRRHGYYCGEIDGYFTPAVSDAIARMQKNYSMRVTGTLTVPVRRALFLP